MYARRNSTTPADLLSEVGALMTGLGVLSVMAIPLALPALLLALVLVLPVLVLVLPVLALWLLVRGISWMLGRAPVRARSPTRAEMAAGRADARPSASA